MWCTVLVALGCAVAQAEASQERQELTEAAKREQAYPGGVAPEEDRCEGTRTVVRQGGAGYATNDVPGCPQGGVLVGTDSASYLYGGEGVD